MSIYVKVWKQPSEQASQCIPHATNIWKTCFVPVPTVSHSRVYNICATCRPWRRARSYGTSARQASQNKANHGKLLEGPGLPGHANSKRSTFEFLPHNSFRNFLWCNFGYAHPGEFDHHMLYIFELNPSRHLSTADRTCPWQVSLRSAFREFSSSLCFPGSWCGGLACKMGMFFGHLNIVNLWRY